MLLGGLYDILAIFTRVSSIKVVIDAANMNISYSACNSVWHTDGLHSSTCHFSTASKPILMHYDLAACETNGNHTIHWQDVNQHVLDCIQMDGLSLFHSAWIYFQWPLNDGWNIFRNINCIFPIILSIQD